ncbi:nucleotidyltransferase domain-containing protein [Paracoccus litorisediminis]|uniref:nucleotidyltransferase domain-containing protein n=1 Tax=Paracoccus litorisediminis TaxID=2006130 RepID=UPI00373348CB
MSLSDRIIAQRNADARKAADGILARVTAELDRIGVDFKVFGSVIRNDFIAGSDVDLMILGAPSDAIKSLIEKICGAEEDETGIKIDLLFADELGPRNVKRLLEH